MISVTCAVIRNDEDEVLIVQRGEATDHPFKWEFPGGKPDDDETPEDCIIREVEEELSLEIVISGRLPVVEYDYGHKQITLIPFVCDTLDELPFLSEHLAFKWLPAAELLLSDLCEADVLVARSYMEGIKALRGDISGKAGDKPGTDTVDKDLQSMINSMMSMQEAEWIASSAIENEEILQKLLEYSWSADKKLAFRASWTLSKVCDKFPEIIYPYLPKIIEVLDKLDNESAQRSFLRILSLTDLDRVNSNQHGILADLCFRALESAVSAIAVKAYSMEILYKLSLKYPDLAMELSASISMLQRDGSAGILARSRMILKKLAAINENPDSDQPM